MNIYNCRFLKPLKINAIVIYPFIFYCDKEPLQKIINHELIHIEQIKRDGVARFYVRYLYEYFQGRRKGLTHFEAYRNISYEAEAFENS